MYVLTLQSHFLQLITYPLLLVLMIRKFLSLYYFLCSFNLTPHQSILYKSTGSPLTLNKFPSFSLVFPLFRKNPTSMRSSNHLRTFHSPWPHSITYKTGTALLSLSILTQLPSSRVSGNFHDLIKMISGCFLLLRGAQGQDSISLIFLSLSLSFLFFPLLTFVLGFLLLFRSLYLVIFQFISTAFYSWKGADRGRLTYFIYFFFIVFFDRCLRVLCAWQTFVLFQWGKT